MPAIELNVDWDTASFDKAFAELEAELTAVARGVTVELWSSILYRTPQYSGSMAASWSYSLGAPQFYDRSYMVEPLVVDPSQENSRWPAANPRSKGHMAAVSIANEDNIGSELRFKLGDVVYIANGVDHGEGPYSAAVESGEVLLRRINQPGMPVKNAVDRIGSKYGVDVRPSEAARLKQFKIGDVNAG